MDSIVRADSDPTNAGSIDFTVTFSEDVTGVDAGDFSLTATGVTGASIGGISGSGSTYTVSVNTGSGDGTIRLDATDDDTIVDAGGSPLGGPGAGNGDFVGQEVYTIDKTSPEATSIVRADASPTNAAAVSLTVNFSEGVTGVDLADFVLATSGGIAGAGLVSVSGTGNTYTVTVAGNTYTATNNGNGTWTLADNTISPALVVGVYNVDARATDAAGNEGTDATTDELQIVADSAPVAVDDLFTSSTDEVFVTPDVRLNDQFLSERPVTVVAFTQPSHGTLVHNGDGAFTYTPTSRYQGIDSFGYTIEDTFGQSSSATVQLAVSSAILVGDWPTFGNGPEHTGYIPGVLGDALPVLDWSVDTVASPQVAVADGRVYAYRYPASGRYFTAFDEDTGAELWQYPLTSGNMNPPSYYDGAVYFQLGNRSDSDLIAVYADTGAQKWKRPYSEQLDSHMAPAIADGRVWVNDGTYGGMSAYSVTNGAQIRNIWLPQVDGWTPTVDGNTVYASLNGTLRYYNATTGNQIGSVVVYSDSAYWTNELAAAKDGVAYMVGNGILAAIDPVAGSVLWQVDGVRDCTPSIANGRIYVLSSYGVRAYDAATGDLLQNYLVDIASTDYMIVTDDSLVVSSNTKTSILDLEDGSTVHTIDNAGRITLANNRLLISSGTILYSYEFHDADNRMPTAVEDLVVATEELSVAVNVTGNDLDQDGDAIGVSAVTDAAHGTVEIIDADTIRYTPHADFFGTDSFTYTIVDGAGGFDTGTVTVVVQPVDDPPAAVGQALYTLVNTPRTILLAASDVEPDLFTFTIVTPPNHGTIAGTGSERTYTPDPNYVGADNFTFRANDGLLDGTVATVTITVVDTNEAPLAVDDRIATGIDTAVVLDLSANDTDREAHELSLDGYTMPANGQLAYDEPSDTLTYTPSAGFTGTDSFTYTVADGFGGTDTGSVTITVGTLSATGDWPTLGGGPEHSGYFPGTLFGAVPQLEWDLKLGTSAVKQVTIADGRVFISDDDGYHELLALDEETGAEEWRYVYNYHYGARLTPPTYADGSVFVLKADDQYTFLASFDAETGEPEWKTGDNLDNDYNMHPTVGAGVVWTNGGPASGLHGYDQETGVKVYDEYAARLYGWTPTFANGKLYTHLGKNFQERNPATGEVVWSLELIPSFSYYSMGYAAPAVWGETAFVNAPGGHLVAIDLRDGIAVGDRELWRVTDGFWKTPAVTADAVYSMTGGDVQARAPADGALLQTYSTGVSSVINWQPIVADDTLIIASRDDTYLFDLATGELIQTLSGGGQLSLANERLYVAGDDGTVRTYRMVGLQNTDVPTAIDLLPQSDSGHSDEDNITDRNNSAGSPLMLGVDGTIAGATVTLYADNTPIGSAVATGGYTTITTDDDSIADLAGNPLGGTGAGNGDFVGEEYTVERPRFGPHEALNTNAGVDAGADFFPEVTTDGAGNWVAVWESNDSLGGTVGTDYDILVSRSTDAGTVEQQCRIGFRQRLWAPVDDRRDGNLGRRLAIRRHPGWSDRRRLRHLHFAFRRRRHELVGPDASEQQCRFRLGLRQFPARGDRPRGQLGCRVEYH